MGVAGNGGEGIFEFVGDARGKFAERGEVFLELHLLLQRSEFSEVGEKADDAADVFGTLSNRGDSDAELPDVARSIAVFNLFAAEDFPGVQAIGNESGKVGAFAKGFTETAITEAALAEGLFRGRVGAGNDALGIDDDEAGGHVARDLLA